MPRPEQSLPGPRTGRTPEGSQSLPSTNPLRQARLSQNQETQPSPIEQAPVFTSYETFLAEFLSQRAISDLQDDGVTIVAAGKVLAINQQARQTLIEQLERRSTLLQEAEDIRAGVRASLTFELSPTREPVQPRTVDSFDLKTPITPRAEKRAAIATIWQERLEQLPIFQAELRGNARWQDVERGFLDRSPQLTDELFSSTDPRGRLFARVAAYLSDPEMRLTLLEEINRVTRQETERLVQAARECGGWLTGYPLVVVGTGWHGASSALELQAFTEGRVVQIDAGKQRGGLFASVLPPTGPDIAAFAVNSKNGTRRHVFNVRSLAGRGQNLNPFSDHAPVQIPAFDFSMYPGNNSFAAAVAVNSFLAGPALQGARVVRVSENRQATTENERLLVTADYQGQPLFLPAFGTVLALGTGETALPLPGRSGVAARVREQSQRDVQRFLEGNTNRLPKVVTGLEFLQMAAARRGSLLNALIDKNVVIAGKGDTALVVLELLTGQAPDPRIYEGYVPQGRGPRTLYWIGPESRSRQQLCEELPLRPRYRVSVSFPRGVDDPYADLIPVPGKVVNFGARSQFGQDQFMVDILEPDGTREYVADADLLIACTGIISDQAGEILSGLTGFGPLRTVRDLDKSALYREVPGWEDRVLLVGPAANVPVSEAERELAPALAQVVKNGDSLWLNTEKVVLATRALGKRFTGEALEDLPF